MIKILIADDQELIRQSLQIILDAVSGFEVTDSVENGKEVIRSIRKDKPDVILMDIRMPEMDGVVCTQIIKENYPDIKIIILTTFDDDEYVFNALKYGASGYLLKGIQTKELIDAIRKVHQGTSMINEDIASKVVAAKLNLSEGTVRNSLSTILSKLDLRDRTQLAIWAVQTGAINKAFKDEVG